MIPGWWARMTSRRSAQRTRTFSAPTSSLLHGTRSMLSISHRRRAAETPGTSEGPTGHDMPEVRQPSRMDARPAPRLIYVVTEDWYFLSHRLPMARAARAAGFEVHVATNIGEDIAEIERQGFTVHPLRF